MQIFDIINPTSVFLTEANILNVKDPHDGHSIQAYLKHYAKSIKTPVAKKMFIKKIQKLLLNDPEFHFAVRELPDDAPEWAHEAMAKKDLMYFQPNPALDNMVEHLTHYIAKMEEDMEGSDGNRKAIATKELAGFVKAESLEILKKKSDEYFERGAKDETQYEGMKEILKKDGFTWFKLETATAFKNAGKTLQNCIGSHWTKAKTDNAGESIIVLLNDKGAMIVAARIQNTENELKEMKGKNNQPPIKAYMPPVAAMINKFKLSLSSGAHHDVMSAGYYFDDNGRKLLTKPQAMKALVTVKKLGKIPGPGNLTLVQPEPKDDSTSATSIFNELYTGRSYSYSSDTFYEARLPNNNPVITATVDDSKQIDKIQTFFNNRLHDESHLQEAVEISKKRDLFKAFVNELAKRNLVTGFNSDTIRHMFWEIGLEWDDEAKQLIPRAEGTQQQEDKKQHKWTKYTDSSTVNTIVQTLSMDHKRSFPAPYEKVFVTMEEEASDRSRNDNDVYLAVVVNGDDASYLVNISGEDVDEDHIGFKKEIDGSSWSRTSHDPKIIKSLIALAKKEKFKLPAPAISRFGVLGDKPENYEKYEVDWKKVSGDPDAMKADFTHLRDEDRFTATYATAMSELGGLDAKDLFDIHERMDTKTDRRYYYGQENNVNKSKPFDGMTPKKAYEQIGKIDSIYKVNVGYGTNNSHGVIVLVRGNRIMKVDKNTEDHKWQGWDDFDEVAEKLNKFADDHKLTYDTTATTTDKRSRKEFRVVDGKIRTMQSIKTDELSRKKKKEGVDELTYKDGWKLERMTPDEQGKWIRRGVQDGVRGQAWLLTDDNGKKRAVVTILHQKIARLFYSGDYRNPGVASDDWPTNYGRTVKKFNPYLKTAMDTFGWKTTKTGVMKNENISPSLLKELERLKDYKVGTDNKARVKDGFSSGIMVSLKSHGWLDETPRDNHRPRYWQLNKAGQHALEKYNELKDSGTPLTQMDTVKGVDPHEDFKMPDKNAPRAAAPAGAARTPRAAGGTTKASQALDKFTDHVNDNGQIPTRSEFIAYMEDDPFNMSKTGAQTYYYTTKKKYAALNESILGDLAQFLLVEPDSGFTSFGDMVFD